MGLFGKIKDALKKTKDNVSSKLRQLFLKNKLGDAFYDELEEILISSDVGVATAEDVVEQVKEEAIGNKVKDEEFVTDLLKDILEDILNEAPGLSAAKSAAPMAWVPLTKFCRTRAFSAPNTSAQMSSSVSRP